VTGIHSRLNLHVYTRRLFTASTATTPRIVHGVHICIFGVM
jgi:hypothetical protein